MDQLQHLRRQQPSLAHLIAVSQIAVDHAVEVVEISRGTEPVRALQGVDQGVLILHQVFFKEPADLLLGDVAAVEIHIHVPVVDLEDDKVHETRDHRLHALRQEEIGKVVVAQGGVFYIDLAYDTHTDLLRSLHGHGLELVDDIVEVLHHALVGHALALPHFAQQVCPALLQAAVGVAPGDLIGAHLPAHIHHQVAVDDRKDRLPENGKGQLEARVFLHAGEVQGHHGHIVKARPGQCLPEQVEIVGGTAAAAGLGDEQGHLMGIIAATMDGINELADDQNGREAGVVMDVLLPLLQNGMAGGVEHLYLVTGLLQDAFQHGEVIRQHLRGQNGILLCHFLGKKQPPGFIVDKLCHITPPPFWHPWQP